MYIVYGLGMQGEAVLYYLQQSTSDEIVGVDIDKNKLNELGRFVDSSRVCLTNELPIAPNGSTLISCVSPEFNNYIAWMCAAKHLNMIDLGGDTEIVKAQKSIDFPDGVHMVPDCGLAPGVVSSFYLDFVDAGWTSVEAFCGGIPKNPKPPLSYCKVFSTEGVIREYCGVANLIKDGKVVTIPTRSARELVFVPGFGVLEADVTSGGTSDIQPIGADFSYKTLRYAGHWDYVEKHILSQPDPVIVLDKLIEPATEDNPDVVILMFRLKDDVSNRAVSYYFWEHDYCIGYRGLTAMAQATGFVAGAVATIINNKEGISVSSGFVGMDHISAEKIIKKIQENFPNQFCEG